jgi:hypothetical protein
MPMLHGFMLEERRLERRPPGLGAFWSQAFYWWLDIDKIDVQTGMQVMW